MNNDEYKVIMERVDRMIADTRNQMRIGTELEKEYYRGWNNAYSNVKNMINEYKDNK